MLKRNNNTSDSNVDKDNKNSFMVKISSFLYNMFPIGVVICILLDIYFLYTKQYTIGYIIVIPFTILLVIVGASIFVHLKNDTESKESIIEKDEEKIK